MYNSGTCEKCEEEKDLGRITIEKTPVKTNDSEKTGHKLVRICKNCYEQGWRPEKIVLGNIKWRNENNGASNEKV